MALLDIYRSGQQYAGGTPSFNEGAGFQTTPVQPGLKPADAKPTPTIPPAPVGLDGRPIYQPLSGNTGAPDVGGQTPSFSNQQVWNNQDVFSSGNPDAMRARLAQTSPGVNFSDADLAALAGQSRADRGDLVAPFGGTGPSFTSYLSASRAPTPLELQNQQASAAFGHQGDFGPVLRQAAPAFAASALTGGTSIAGQAARDASANNSGPAYRGPSADGSVDIGSLLGGGLGLAGSIDQQHGTQNYSDWARNQGQSYRDLLNQSYSNPSAYLSSPEVSGAVQQGTDALARSLSVRGNPIGSGNSLQQLQNYATNNQLDRLAQYRQQLGGFGGLQAINQSIPGAATAAIGARGDTYNAGGSLLSDIFRRGGILGGGVGNTGNYTDTNPFANTTIDMGNATQFDPNVDWGSLYG